MPKRHNTRSAWGRAGKNPPIPPGEAFVVVADAKTGELIIAQEKQLTTPPPAGYLRFRSAKGAEHLRGKLAAGGVKLG